MKKQKTNKKKGIFLTIFGSLFLAGGVFLIPIIVEEAVGEKVEKITRQKQLELSSAKESKDDGDSIKNESEKKKQKDTGQVPFLGPWEIQLSESYEILEETESLIEEMIVSINYYADSKLLIKGINATNKSTRRAMFGAETVARKIKGLIDILDDNVIVSFEQNEDAEGLVVEVSLEVVE